LGGLTGLSQGTFIAELKMEKEENRIEISRETDNGFKKEFI